MTVQTATVRARRTGHAIVEEARRRGVELIVLAAEEPSRIRGGARIGGRATLDNFVGEVTKYVVTKAPCRVILTAPPAGDRAPSDGRAGDVVDPLAPSAGCLWPMFLLIVGAGRVGSQVAKSALASGHEVSVLDEDPLSHERLDEGQQTTWEDAGGRFTVGQAIEVEALLEAGIEQADIFIASTDGDNTNLVIAQIAQKKFGIDRVLVRVMDPARAAWYAEQGLQTVCPTMAAIDQFTSALEVV